MLWRRLAAAFPSSHLHLFKQQTAFSTGISFITCLLLKRKELIMVEVFKYHALFYMCSLKVFSFVLGGISVVAGLYLTNAIVILGATEQIPYVIAGVIIGSLLFSLASFYVFSRISLLYSLLPAIVIIAGERIYVASYPLASNLVILLLFAGCCSFILPAGKVVRARSVGYLFSGSVIVFLISAGIYLLNGYSGLAEIAIAVESVGLFALLLILAAAPNASKKSLGKIGINNVKKMIAILTIFIILFHPAVADTQLTATPIKHVIIMMENHSFDNLFGVYPISSIIYTPIIVNSSKSILIQQIQQPFNLLNAKELPELTQVPKGVFVTRDPVEGYIAYHLDWANGTMLGFLRNSGPQAMTYFNSSQLGIEWSSAEQYSLADMYFASQLTETAPNRLFSLAGYSPVINDYGPPPYIPYSQSIFSELDRYGISWGYYVQNPSKGVGTLSYFYGMNMSRVGSWDSFFEQLSNGSLPSVSWLMPVDGGAVDYSQGPPADVLKGQLWMLYTIQKVEESPLWNSTAIFITYDEGGGYYDHVAPPKLMDTQLGERVPMILVSPYAKENYVSNTIMTHTSLLAFIDYNWHIPALNSLVANSNLPLDMFNFNVTYSNGELARPAIDFKSLGFPMPDSASFDLSSLGKIYSLSSYFPVTPQFPFDQLPYSRVGESNVTLAKLSSGVYIASNTSYTPFYESDYFVALIYAINMIIAAIIARKLYL